MNPGHLAGSARGTCKSWSCSCKFEPHIECRDNFKIKKSKIRKKMNTWVQSTLKKQ